MADTIALLLEYAESESSIGSSEQTLARIAARWLAVEPTAVSDPLLKDILDRARFHKTTHVETFMFATTRKANILDYFGPRVSIVETAPVRNKPYRIYCDGACRANGRRGARAGFGGVIYAPTGDVTETVSEPLTTSEAQTNQRAELRALQWAFGKAMALPENNIAEIHTDSEYALKCFTEWGPLWAAKGWRKATGGEVLHQDILRPMWEIWKARGGKMRLHHVAAHTGSRDIHSIGNAKADELAVASLLS